MIHAQRVSEWLNANVPVLFLDWLNSYLWRFVSRVLLGGILTAMLMMQVVLADKLLPASDKEVLSDIVWGMGMYDFVGYLLLLWVAMPIIGLIWEFAWRFYRNGTDIFTDSYWRETA